MIPVANITLEDALLDNPNFRANIRLFEGQVFFIESWLVALVLFPFGLAIFLKKKQVLSWLRRDLHCLTIDLHRPSLLSFSPHISAVATIRHSVHRGVET